jgi:hypothetical protein
LRAQTWSARADFEMCARAVCCAGESVTSNQRGGGVGDWWVAAFGIRDSAFVEKQRSSEVGGENRVGIKALGIKASRRFGDACCR